ncbi:MAG: DUF444 family protein [Deltaproteobacteria bacterium]|nr:MAG: DUF444 family protein [Deltaproteobacteria bacterium]
MAQKIDTDHARFRHIVRGKIKENLRRYITRGEILGKKGRDTVSIPLPQIQLPRFKYAHKDTGGVGQGDGEVGTILQPGDVEGKAGEAGSDPSEHVLEVDVTIDELAAILGEELELPRIEPRGKHTLETRKVKYTGVHRVGPESLRHFKRTYKAALKRQIASGLYDPERPVIVPIREDKRYRSWKVSMLPESNAVIIYMMDVSGSMGDEQKELVRIESFWLDTWLQSQYDGLEVRYITHDAAAREVDRHTFFHTRESGGTMISSAYQLCADIIDSDYRSGEWNIYPFHFSDGDNWSSDDTQTCIRIMKERLLPVVNQFGYGQVESPYGSGQFIKDLRRELGDEEKLVLSEIPDRDAIIGSIKDFLGKGR